MPREKTGQHIPCMICGTLVYRRKAYLLRGHTRMTCGKPECKSESHRGANNPFWGKEHTEETKAKIDAAIKSRPVPKRKGGPPKGYKHTPEARALMSAAVKERWRTQRDKMLSALPRGEEHMYRKMNYEPRYRSNFSPAQRREWGGEKCLWCDATEDLVLDHIIPVMAGGKSVKENAQTLCQPCNLWKMWNVDRPLRLAGLGSQGGPD